VKEKKKEKMKEREVIEKKDIFEGVSLWNIDFLKDF